MEPATIQRKLTTIVLADIAGYSRLMSRDEEDTHARCASLSRELVEPAIAAHGGLLVKKTGDGMISWGAISACMVFVQGPTSFIIVRFLLGVAEAGFFPGVILYLTYWFP